MANRKNNCSGGVIKQIFHHLKDFFTYRILIHIIRYNNQIITPPKEEQKGKERAEYGKGLLKELSKKLIRDYGRGFDESNLRNMRMFYLTFPKCDALRHELSWTHYKHLIRIEKEEVKKVILKHKYQYLLDMSIAF